MDVAITTRPATDADHSSIHRIHRLAYRNMIERQFGYWDDPRQRGLLDCNLATDSYEIVLWENTPCGYFSYSSDSDRLHLIDFAIHPEYQRRGIGSLILERLKGRAKLKNQLLTLGAFKTNSGARRFYERHGFKKTGETTVHILYRWPA